MPSPRARLGPILIAGGTAAVTALALRPLGNASVRWWLLAPIVPALFVGLARAERRPGEWGAERSAFTGFAFGVALVSAIRLAHAVIASVLHPPDWDFGAFYLAARVAAARLNFYDPESFRMLTQQGSHAPDFWAETVNVGFWYPPPTMFLLLPFGWLEVGRAVVLWYAVQIGALVLSIALLWRLFLARAGLTGLAVGAALLLLLRSTLSTFAFGQTNALELLALLLLWKHRERAQGGLWLALAAITKPFALGMLGPLVARRRWRALLGTAAAFAALGVASVAAFGWTTCHTFLVSSPARRIPAYIYSQEVNQSLSGALLRLLDLVARTPPPAAKLLVLAAWVAVLLVTVWAATRRRLDERLQFGLFLVAALMLYPASLEHYSMLVTLPLLLTWSALEGRRGSVVAAACLATPVYILIARPHSAVFVSYVLLWTAFVAAAFASTRRADVTSTGTAAVPS